VITELLVQPAKGRGVMFRQSCPNLYQLTNGPVNVYWIGIRQPVPLVISILKGKDIRYIQMTKRLLVEIFKTFPRQ